MKYIADSNGYRADVSYQDKNGDIVSTQSPASYQHGSAYQQVQSTPGTYLEKPSISYYKKAVPTSPLYLVSTPYPPRQHYQDINVQPRQPIVSQASIAPVVHVHHRGGSRQNQENHENYYGLQGNQIVGYYGQPSTQNPYINSDY